jgi:hypothetical protein
LAIPLHVSVRQATPNSNHAHHYDAVPLVNLNPTPDNIAAVTSGLVVAREKYWQEITSC